MFEDICLDFCFYRLSFIGWQNKRQQILPSDLLSKQSWLRGTLFRWLVLVFHNFDASFFVDLLIFKQTCFVCILHSFSLQGFFLHPAHRSQDLGLDCHSYFLAQHFMTRPHRTTDIDWNYLDLFKLLCLSAKWEGRGEGGKWVLFDYWLSVAFVFWVYCQIWIDQAKQLDFLAWEHISCWFIFAGHEVAFV